MPLLPSLQLAVRSAADHGLINGQRCGWVEEGSAGGEGKLPGQPMFMLCGVGVHAVQPAVLSHRPVHAAVVSLRFPFYIYCEISFSLLFYPKVIVDNTIYGRQ